MEKLLTELRLRGFSEQTIKAYIYYNKLFLKYIKKDVDVIVEDDIKKYIGYLLSEGNYSAASVGLVKAALKFFYDEVLKKGIVTLRTPKIDKKLPVVLNKEEVSRLIESASNEKSKLIIKMLYSSGLRLSECINMKVDDLEFNEKIAWVRGGKGRKDRMVILSEKLAKELEKYFKDRDFQSEYAFPGPKGIMSSRNARKIVTNAAKSAGIKKKVSPHTMRHCFATHLLESGVDIRKIQELLGHANLQTTQIYTRVSKEELKKVISPLDEL